MPLGMDTGWRMGWGVAERAAVVVGGLRLEGCCEVVVEVEKVAAGEESSRNSVPSASTAYLLLSVIDPAQKRPAGSMAPSLKRILHF